MPEIDLIIEGLDPATEGEDDPADLVPESSTIEIARIGDLWALGRNKVLCGNALSSTDLATLMGGKKANIAFTDPPFNVPISGHVTGHGKTAHREFVMGSGEMSDAEFRSFLARALARLAQQSQPSSILYVCIDWRHAEELVAAGRAANLDLINICVWVKNNPGLGSFYRSAHEFVAVFRNGRGGHRNNVQLGKFGRSRSNVWNYAGCSSFSRVTSEGDLLALHPTVKPAALVADAILDTSARGDLVIDPFLGSGTTIIAAERTGRICYGLELDPLYVDTIIRRWQAFTGDAAIESGSGRSFNELEGERRERGE
jgi:DNA modification methylase